MADNQNKIDQEDIKILRDQTDALREAYNLRVNISSEAKSQLSLARQINIFAQNQLANQSESLALNRKSSDIKRDINKANSLEAKLTNEIKTAGVDKAKILKEQLDLTTKIKLQLEKEEKSTKNINDAMGLTGGALSTINKMFGGALGDTKGIEENTRKQLKSMELQGKLSSGAVGTWANLKGKAQGFGVLTGEIGKSIGKNMVDPITILMMLFENSKSINQFQNSLGVSYGHATALREEMSNVAAKSGEVYINSAKLQKSFMALNQEMGFVADISGETLTTMTFMNEKLGLGTKAASNLTMMFKLQGDNTETIASNTVDALNSQIKMGNVTLTSKQILGEIANTTNAIKVSLGANPIAIGKAIIAAKQLGAELSDIDATMNSLLNFEQSINAELEFELVSGKQLNLEKARLLALNNDYAGVAEEVAKQGIDYAYMTGANRIEQELAAKALGYSREQLTKITLQQEMQNMSAQEIKDAYGDGAYEQYKALDASEKLAATLAKLKGIFSDAMVALTPIIDAFASLVAGVTWLMSGATIIGETIGGWIQPIAAMVGHLGIVGKILKGIASIAVLYAAYSAYGGLAARGPIGLIAGIIAAATITAAGMGAISAISMNDGVIGKDGGMVVNSPKGSIQLNKDDSIIAGTNLGGKNNSTPPPPPPPPAPVPIIIKSVTQFDSFGANNPMAPNGRYQSLSNHESKFA
jgi:hypothetical protein